MTPKEKARAVKLDEKIKKAKLNLAALRKKRSFYRLDKRFLRFLERLLSWPKSLFSR